MVERWNINNFPQSEPLSAWEESKYAYDHILKNIFLYTVVSTMMLRMSCHNSGFSEAMFI